jgi:AraC-like DNA-binding protein
MLTEASSLARIAYRIGDTLQHEYGLDPTPLYENAGLDPVGPEKPGSRISNKVLNKFWDDAYDLCQDPALGIRIGKRAKPGMFFVLGHAWLASATLVEAMERMIRYESIIDTGITDIDLIKSGDHYIVSEAYPNPADYPGKLSIDMSIASLVTLSAIVRNDPVLPTRLELMLPADAPRDIYDDVVAGPVMLECEKNALYFEVAPMEAALPGAIPDVMEATSRIAERYIESQGDTRIAHQVRELLVQMLPSGSVDQETVAARLYCSPSTLQRQLSSERSSYRAILESTRRDLAEAYLNDGKYSHAQIAFLVGFSDQSNFSRAFKRWTGMSPGRFQKEQE